MKSNLLKTSLYSAGAIGSLFIPMIAFAQAPSLGSTAVDPGLFNVLGVIGAILDFLIPILITLTVVYFIWSVLSYVFGKDEEKKKIARSNMMYGVIALFVIVAVWGLVNVLQKTFGLKTTVQKGPQQCAIGWFYDPGANAGAGGCIPI